MCAISQFFNTYIHTIKLNYVKLIFSLARLGNLSSSLSFP